MSLITDDPDKSPRDCSRRKRRGSNKWWWIAASSTVLLLLLALFIIVILWIRPPEFSLLAASASSNKNASSSSSSSVMVVVDAAFSARNPNGHAAVLYEALRLSASYGGVALRGSAPLEGDEVMMSASLRSASGAALGGGGLLRTRIEGRLRWKVGAWVSGRHGLAVDCVVLLPSSSSESSHCATHTS